MVAVTLDPIARPARQPGLRAVASPAGRRPVSLLLGAVAAALLMVAMAYLAFAPPLAEPGTIPVADTTYVVEAGDTMWSIAQDQAPAGHAAAYVERLVAVNGTSTVDVGQVVQLPRS